MRKIFFSGKYEHAELLTVAILIPIAFLCSSVQYPEITPEQYGYYHAWYYSPPTFIASIVQSLGMGCLIALLVGFFSPEVALRWEKGLTSDIRAQLACAIALLGIFIFYFAALDGVLHAFWGISIPKPDWTYAADGWERLQALWTSLINGPAEELLRAYFIARLKSLTKSSAIAILGSAFIFSIYHLYYGWIMVGYFFVIGILCGWLYLKKNYLLALIAWHIMADMSAMVTLGEWKAFMGTLGIPWWH